MKEIFLGKPTEKQLEWMRAHAPVTPAGPGTDEPAEPEEPAVDEPKSETVVEFSNGQSWQGMVQTQREDELSDADLENAGAFQNFQREDVVSIAVQDGITAAYGLFNEHYCNLDTVSLPSTTQVFDHVFEPGCGVKRIVVRGWTQGEAEFLLNSQGVELPEGCVIEGELG